MNNLNSKIALSRSDAHNENCPFTLEPLKQPMYVRLSSSGYKRGFQLESIANYLLVTGNTFDPIDKDLLTQEDLEVIDFLLKENNIVKDSVSNITSISAKRRYAEKKAEDERITIIQDELTEYLCDIFDELGYIDNITPIESNISLFLYRQHCTLLWDINKSKYLDFASNALDLTFAKDDITEFAKQFIWNFLWETSDFVVKENTRIEIQRNFMESSHCEFLMNNMISGYDDELRWVAQI